MLRPRKHSDEVGVRIRSQDRPMCPKFHFDRVPVRLIHSLHGEGSEWVDNPLVLQTENLAKIDSWIKKAEEDQNLGIKQAPPGSVVIMKGANWKENAPPVIHRSPHQDQPRVVLTLDQA